MQFSNKVKKVAKLVSVLQLNILFVFHLVYATSRSFLDILHVEASKLMSQICSDDEAVVILKRTTTGLIAKIDLPGAPHEDSNNVDEGEMKCNAELEVDSAMSVGDSDPHLRSSDCSSPCSLGSERDDVSNENIQLKEINAELMRQVEKLRSQNERLEQQVAVLSEGSAYI